MQSNAVDVTHYFTSPEKCGWRGFMICIVLGQATCHYIGKPGERDKLIPL